MKAVLVFCEGRHDVVFAQRSLGVHGGCQWVGRAIGELPSPFGRSRIARKGLIATRIERHAIEDLAIQAAAHSPLPSFESVVENTATDTIFFMVRANGKTQSDPIVSLLRALSVTLAGVPVGTFEVSEYAAAFLFDANGEGVASTLRDFGARYTSEFGDLSSVAHASWLDETTIPVGCFVFHKSSQDPTGTLEQHLRPMAAGAWPQQDAKAELFIDDARRPDHKVSRSDAERLKAIITAAGQLRMPHHKQLRSTLASARRTSSLQHLKDALNPEPDTNPGIGIGALAVEGGRSHWRACGHPADSANATSRRGRGQAVSADVSRRA